MARVFLNLGAVVVAVAFGTTRSQISAQQGGGHQHQHSHEESGAVETMAHDHRGADPHMKLSPTRPATPADHERAEALVQTLRRVLEPYRDSARAERDGYRPFLPQLRLPQYHFTNWKHGFRGAFTFDPEKPTSLLYKRQDGQYVLSGAMYTAPARASADQLHARVPLSIARWHAHVNICLPPRNATGVDWTQLGFKGSIATPAACDEAGGRFHPQIFGWMVHVQPFETDPARIWAH
jgi:hypothetical protein